MKLALKHRLAVPSIVIALVMLGLRLTPHPPLANFAPSSLAILAADKTLLRLTLTKDEQYRLWTPLEKISPNLVEAVQLKEDRWFYWHFGVNPSALIRGAWKTYSGENRQGGSTITMQLARLMTESNTHSPLGKLKQVGMALWLELRYSKHDIFEAYLNLAPYGRNIQGVGAASLIYFQKTPDVLSLQEALTLAVIPQRPNQADIGSSRSRLFDQWQTMHTISAGEKSLFNLPVELKSLSNLPFKAPHYAEQVINANEDASNKQIITALNPRLQSLLERQIHQYIAQNSVRGIKNATAMLVDTRNQGVVAMVGSADFHNQEIDGQVNGTQGKRSPGSTLKPFIYGLAIDQGLIHPKSILKDAPTAFGPFQPENFDGRFVGPLSATKALFRSRNIPAVYLASQLKNPSLYDFLKMAGVSRLQSEAHYGLALALGGGEVSMEELAMLYTMLANRGELKPLHYSAPAPTKASEQATIQLLSPEASFLVLDMLSQNPRPDGIPAANSRRWKPMWKTGTSWGFRDAWTVGVVGPYVLAVWVGNFDGASNPAFVGIEAAAPLFFRISDALPIILPSEEDRPNIPPRSLKQINICTASGELPNAWCPEIEKTWFIPGKSPIKVSTLHQPLIIDNRTGKAACPPIDPSNTHTEVFEFWSSDMMRLFREAGMPRRVPPTSSCGLMKQNLLGDAPQITSPMRSVVYSLRASKPDETIALQATASGDAHLLYWFLDKDFLGSVATGAGGLPWRPASSGWHNLSVVDDKGRSASRDLQIEIAP